MKYVIGAMAVDTCQSLGMFKIEYVFSVWAKDRPPPKGTVLK